MKKTIFSILLSLMCFTPFVSLAQDSGPIGGIDLPEGPDINRPNSGTGDVVVCQIWPEYLEFQLPPSVEELHVSIVGNGIGVVYTITSQNNSIPIALPSGFYTIECISPDRRVFSGYLIL